MIFRMVEVHTSKPDDIDVKISTVSESAFKFRSPAAVSKQNFLSLKKNIHFPSSK